MALFSPPRTPTDCPRCGGRSFTLADETVWRDERGVFRADISCLHCGELLADWSAYRAAWQRHESILEATRPRRRAAG